MRRLTLKEALALVESCEVEPDTIATNGTNGEVHFHCHRMTAEDWRLYTDAVTGSAQIDPESIIATNDTIEGSNTPSVMVIIKTEG